MAYQALYRRWRPTTFEAVIGQTATVHTLRSQIESGRIAHAYLFCGCRGTGKTTMAKLMSRAINCMQPHHGDPCGECDVCRAILNESTMDVLEIDAASNSRVEEMRELLDTVAYPPQMGKYKVYIIDEVHMLSTSAFNALLKTLEEPPEHVVFILATTDPQKVPATILSRVQRYDFGRIPASLMVERMKEALAEMNLSAEEEALQIVARAAEGAMRDAFSILDMCVAGAVNGIITAAQVRDSLGTSDRDFTFQFMDAVANRDAAGVLRRVDQLMRSGREPQVFLKELSSHTRMLLTVQAVEKDASSILDITPEDELRMRKQAALFSSQRLLRVLDCFLKAEGELRYASSPRIGLESAALHACEEQRGEDSSALLERIAELESKLAALQGDIESGRLAVQAAPAVSQKPAQGDAAPRAKAAPKEKPVPQGEKAVWEALLKELSKTNPAVFGLLRNERFLGEENGVYRVRIPLAKKDFSYVKLNMPDRKQTIEQMLTDISQKPARFEAVLEQDTAMKQTMNLLDNNAQSLIDTFGRDMVQIDEEGF
ncbi:MAG: DNA polymerase III subunit gamma/tau [Clostridiales bacterium]|nr:DNA polymerase III subunit gamma/tau [Clostridiales bacterium]